jgi:hypothetical protein
MVAAKKMNPTTLRAVVQRRGAIPTASKPETNIQTQMIGRGRMQRRKTLSFQT